MEDTKYKKALERDPNDVAALRALGEQAAANGRWEELVGLLRREASVLPDGPEKADLFLRAGRVKQRRLNDLAGALEDFAASRQACPTFGPAREAQREIFVAQGDWESVAASLREEADEIAESNPRRSAALELVRAEVCRFRLGDNNRAREACRTARQRNAELRAVLIPLMEMAFEEERWDELCSTVSALAATAADADERTGWKFLKAHVLETRLNEPVRAAETLASIIAEADERAGEAYVPTVHLARSELFEANPSETDSAEDLKRLVDITGSGEEPSGEKWRAAIMHRLGESAESRGDIGGALQCLGEARRLDGSDPRPLRRMARLQRQEGRTEDVVDTYSALLEIGSDDSVSSLWHMLKGQVLDYELNKPGEALEEYRSSQSWAESLHAAELEAGALRRLGKWDELACLLGELAETVTDDKLKATYWAEAAQVYRFGLNDPAGAAEALRRSLGVAPTALAMVRALADCYQDTADITNWVRAVMGQERLVGQKDYLVHIGLLAGILWRKAGRDDEAFKSCSMVLKHDERNLEALSALEDICYRQRSYKNLYGIQRRMIESLGDRADLKRSILLDNASLLLRRLDNAPAAAQVFAEALNVDPGSVAALMELRWRAFADNRWEDYYSMALREADLASRPPSLLWRTALAGWARLDKKDEAAGLLDEVASRCRADPPLLTCLTALHFHRRDWMAWLERAGELVQLVGEPARPMIFLQMAGVHRWRVESPETAAECYRRMIELNEEDVIAHEAIRELYLESGNYEELGDAYAGLAGLEPDDSLKAAKYYARADLYDGTENYTRAVSDFRRVLEYEPDNAAALRRLERLYAMLNNPAAQIEVLKREIFARQEPKVQVLLHLRIGALWEAQSKADEAIAAYNKVTAIDPGETDALEALRRLHWQEGHWRELADTLEKYAGTVPDAERKVQLYHEMARVFEENLSDLNRAVSSLEAAIEVDPKHLETLTELERLYEATESWRNELNVLGRQLELLRDAGELHRVHFKMGAIQEEKTNDPAGATASYVKAHDLQPQHLETLNALERLYDKAGDASRLVRVLEEKAVLLPDERIRLYMWIGRLWDEKLGDPQKAIASYRRVIDLDPKHLEALGALEKLYEKTGDWENLIKTIDAEAGAVRDEARAVELYARAGSLWVEKFRDDDKALEEYGRALQVNSRHRPSLDACRKIHARAGRWEEVVSLYGREVEFTSDPQAKARLLALGGRVIEEKLGDADRASRQYELALRSDPNCMEAVRPLANIYFHQQKWEQAEPLFRKWVDSLTGEDDPGLKAQVHYRQGRAFQGLSKDKEALEKYSLSLEFKPGYIEPLRARSGLYAQRKEWKNALDSENELLAVYEKQDDKKGVGTCLLHIGYYLEQLGQVEEAINTYNRALETAGEMEDVLERLARLYSEKALYNKVAGVLDRLIALHKGTDAEARVRLRKGVLLEEKVNDREGALRCYESALSLDPSFNEARYHAANVLASLSRWQEAEAAAGKLLETESDKEKLADAHCLLGRIAKDGKNDLSAARTSYEKALEIVPGHLKAMDHIGEILEAQGDWQGYVKTFEQFLKDLPPAAQDKALGIHLRLGQVWRDKLGDRERAIVEFNNAVKINPDSPEAHAALAELYLRDKRYYPQAIRENNLLLKIDPFRTQSYRDLAKVFEEQREVDKAFCAYAILDFMGALEKWDRTNYEARLPHLPLRSDKTLDDGLRDRALIHPAARHPATVLLGALGVALCKVFGGPNPTGEKAPGGHPVRKLAEEIAGYLGVGNFEVYLDESGPPGVVWYPRAVPSFGISPKIFEAASDRGKRFLVARGLEGIANGLFAVWGLEESEIRKRLLAAVRVFRSDVAVPGMQDKEASSSAKQIKKEVPRKVRKSLDEAAEGHHNQERSWPFGAWYRAMQHSANRGGLVICAHPGEAARTLLAMEGLVEYGAQADPARMNKSDQLKELLKFAVSDQYFVTRKKVGFSLY